MKTYKITLNVKLVSFSLWISQSSSPKKTLKTLLYTSRILIHMLAVYSYPFFYTDVVILCTILHLFSTECTFSVSVALSLSTYTHTHIPTQKDECMSLFLIAISTLFQRISRLKQSHHVKVYCKSKNIKKYIIPIS